MIILPDIYLFQTKFNLIMVFSDSRMEPRRVRLLIRQETFISNKTTVSISTSITIAVFTIAIILIVDDMIHLSLHREEKRTKARKAHREKMKNGSVELIVMENNVKSSMSLVSSPIAPETSESVELKLRTNK